MEFDYELGYLRKYGSTRGTFLYKTDRMIEEKESLGDLEEPIIANNFLEEFQQLSEEYKKESESLFSTIRR